MPHERPPSVVVITGASAGVGRATARRFAEEGAHIGLIARGRDGLEAARGEVEQRGGRALVLPLDVADADRVEEAAAAVETQFGPIDVWINNAMLSVFSPAEEMTPDEYRRVTEVTYLGAVHGTLAVLRRMRTRDRGVIVQVGSALAYRAIPLQSAYCAAKHALLGFTESLRTELIHDGSRVHLTMVHLPALNTPQFDWVKSRLPRRAQPVPPIFQPEVAAEAVHWSAHHRRRELLVGWPTVKAVMGDKLAPGTLDRYLARHGYEAQQTDEPAASNRPHNLWEPLPGDHGAHGRFTDRAQGYSLQLWASQHRGWLAGAGVTGLGLLAGALIAREGSRPRWKRATRRLGLRLLWRMVR
jgi:NAD(P)-dependent dehydrogenase (short-subunit alcohol dehydrogenase family)